MKAAINNASLGSNFLEYISLIMINPLNRFKILNTIANCTTSLKEDKYLV